MKLKWVVVLAALVSLAVLLACFIPAHVGSAASATPFLALSGVPVPEIPAKAAELVHSAAAPDRDRTAQDVLRAVSAVAKPGVLPYAVSAICRGNPKRLIGGHNRDYLPAA